MAFLVRLFWGLAGLIFVISALAAALLLAMVWGLRWVWAKLTGRPMGPWGLPLDVYARWKVFRAGGRSRAGPSAADVVNARSRGETADSPVALGQRGDVSDVSPRSTEPDSR